MRHFGRCTLLAALAFVGAARAQTPYVIDEWRYGRHSQGSDLSYCVDRRDPDWPVAGDIGAAIAGAMLLQPKPVVIAADSAPDDLDVLYYTLLNSCDLYLGFKLIPDTLPDWLTITRPYYRTSYLLVAKDTGFSALADLPREKAIASTLGTAADLRLVQYLASLASGDRWSRYPMADDAAALRAVVTGSAAAALVWAPSFWALRRADSALLPLREIAPKPLPVTSIEVGAALLGQESYLRSAVDRAIASLLADGSIAALLARHSFPAEPPA